MNDDFQAFRELYAQAFSWTDEEFEKQLANSLNDADSDSNSSASFKREFADMLRIIRKGPVKIVPWSDAAVFMRKGIKRMSLFICLGKALRFNRFSGIAIKRLFSIPRWQAPFNAVDKNLSEMNYSVWQYLLDSMHEKITWGHNWFSVGEWSISNDYYVGALIIAVATNNIDAIEATTHFLVDTYVASGDYGSAIEITQDFIASEAYRKTSSNYMTRRMLESISIALAMEGKVSDCQMWLNKIPELCETKPEEKVSDWKIVLWLTDINRYKNNYTELNNLKFAVNAVTKLRKNWEDIEKAILKK